MPSALTGEPQTSWSWSFWSCFCRGGGGGRGPGSVDGTPRHRFMVRFGLVRLLAWVLGVMVIASLASVWTKCLRCDGAGWS